MDNDVADLITILGQGSIDIYRVPAILNLYYLFRTCEQS